MEENTCVDKIREKKKTLSIRRWTRSETMQFYFGLNDNRFCPKENILVLLEQICSCKFLLSSKRQFPLSFSPSIHSPEKEGKTENQKAEKKEKRTKIKQKKKTNLLQIFPVAPLSFSP